ncbi:hypothetical protein B296_00043415 [Ensete ventricosum]|uniref:Uncharacterized protein n=1 Tax=Ensete ventricosum TaxID=4639 RepID=A0A426WY13_ENSVE|nr:hypothetical protein B296_00043415 [Ensete ventricosum]
MPAPLSDSFPDISMSVSLKRLRMLAVLHTTQLGPPRLYDKCFYITYACLSIKVSPPRDLLESPRLTKEKTGQKKQFPRDP